MIKIDIINNSKGFKPDFKLIDSHIRRIFARLFSFDSAIIEISFVSDQKIAFFNRKYLKHSGSTDILSFPDRKKENDPIKYLGSLTIAPNYLKKHHQDLLEVLSHGMLHLAGFDHETDPDNWKKASELVSNELH